MNIYVGMFLMVSSTAVAWRLVVSMSDTSELLFVNVSKIALFYCLWALYKVLLEGNSKELGHISNGLLALASGLEKRNYALAAIILLLLNFAAPLGMCLSAGPTKIAKLVQKREDTLGVIWACVFIAYLAIQMGLWSMVLHKFYQLPSDGWNPFPE
jgi:hypothetical protein